MDENQNQWYNAEGIDQSLVSDKVKTFTNSDGSMNVNELLKSYDSSQRYIGAAVKIPQDGAPQEEVAAFYSKLGRPESADKYTWTPPEGISVEGATAENFKAFKELCFKLGLTNKQTSGVLDGWSDIVKNLEATRTDLLKKIASESRSALSAPNEWGGNFEDKYKATLALVEKLGIRPHLEAAGVLDSVEVLKAFNSIVDAGAETGLKGASGGAQSSAERLAELKKNPAYLNAGHPDHAKILSEINSLIAG